MKMKIDVWPKERARLYNTFAFTSASTNSFHKICERNSWLHYILRLTLGNFGPFVINHSTPMSKWLKKSKCLGFLCGFPLLKILEMSKTTRISNTFWGFHIFKQLKYLKIFENIWNFQDSLRFPVTPCSSHVNTVAAWGSVILWSFWTVNQLQWWLWIQFRFLLDFLNDQFTWPSVAVLSSFCVLTDILSKGFILRCYDTLK